MEMEWGLGVTIPRNQRWSEKFEDTSTSILWEGVYFKNRCFQHRTGSGFTSERYICKSKSDWIGSRKLTETEKRYDISEKELFVVLWTITKY